MTAPALDINFAAKRRAGSAVGGALLLLGVAALATVVVAYRGADAELALLEQRHERVARQQQPARTVQPPQRTASAARDDSLAMARVAALAQPWGDVLLALEQSASPAVALLSVEGQGKSRQLRLTGEARSMDDVLAFARRLRESARIDAVQLTNHEERLTGAVTVLRFSLDASWKSAP